jgi:ribose 1,5-bisphosphokinase
VTARYALYFAPLAPSAWPRFGESALVGDARRYGFHATLKAPFRLAFGTRAQDLVGELDAWCATRTACMMPPLQVARLDDFVALVPSSPEPRLDALAAECLLRFERFRAPLCADEMIRRLKKPLSERQYQLLQRWGYPYVLDEYRFHLSLTGALGGAPAPRFMPPDEPLVFDGISLFCEPAPGAAFRAVHRSAFRSGGRLIYVAGPSGAGKDSVLNWAKRRLRAGAPVVFARRTITRAPEEHEDHLAATPEEFEARRARGEFAMHWDANGQRYGIGQEIRLWLAQGLTVVVSGSREYLPEALRQFPDMQIVHVTAHADVLKQRLIRRGRETPEAVQGRLRRAQRFSRLARIAAAQVVNDGDLDRAGREFLDYLLKHALPGAAENPILDRRGLTTGQERD